MKKTIGIIALFALVVGILPVQAETDYVARKWFEMLCNGTEGSYKGFAPALKNVRTTGLGTTTYGIGAAAGGVSVVEYGDAVIHQTVITASDLPVVMIEGGTGTNGVGSVKIYDFPEGRILIEGVTVDSFTTTVDTNALDDADGGDYAFGTVAASGASGLSSTEVDIAPSASIDPITNVVSTALAASAQFDGTTTAKDLYLNMEVDDADIAAGCTNTVDFAITITWKNLGDY